MSINWNINNSWAKPYPSNLVGRDSFFRNLSATQKATQFKSVAEKHLGLRTLSWRRPEFLQLCHQSWSPLPSLHPPAFRTSHPNPGCLRKLWKPKKKKSAVEGQTVVLASWKRCTWAVLKTSAWWFIPRISKWVSSP